MPLLRFLFGVRFSVSELALLFLILPWAYERTDSILVTVVVLLLGLVCIGNAQRALDLRE